MIVESRERGIDSILQNMKQVSDYKFGKQIRISGRFVLKQVLVDPNFALALTIKTNGILIDIEILFEMNREKMKGYK